MTAQSERQELAIVTGASTGIRAQSERQKLAIVTGASTGIGAATAHELAARGFHVLAGVRRDKDADAIRQPNIEPLILDITNSEHIHALGIRVQEDPQGRAVRALVNNAGVGMNVPFEVIALDEWRRLFEVNFFGHVAVTQTILPSLIRSKGRIINISSVGGKVAGPTYGPYASTKWALEAVSDSLRRELAPLGVRVVVIEPGGVRTEMPGRAIAYAKEAASSMTPEMSERYAGLVHAITAQTAAFTGPTSGVSAEAAAAVIVKAVTAKRPSARYTVGRDAALLTFLARILPDRILDFIFAAGLRPYFPKEPSRTA